MACRRYAPPNVPEERPDPEALLDQPDAVRGMAEYLVNRLASKVDVRDDNRQIQLTLLLKE